ncbi:hypothetical protein JOQ06_027156 [Pogonophryne albipinna]|uniref:Uncharacterized protein n=1 Tax=Pogonophryne albipinna TaxID=1090488 RepID=A0AAD6BDN4_9TELE|nr:hypothetical protein JOQ06_027156 [Pogonophryne albipinna]
MDVGVCVSDHLTPPCFILRSRATLCFPAERRPTEPQQLLDGELRLVPLRAASCCQGSLTDEKRLTPQLTLPSCDGWDCSILPGL